MRCDVRNMIRQACNCIPPKRDTGAYRFMLGQLSDHLKELGERHTAGDTKAIEEFLDLYCLRPITKE